MGEIVSQMANSGDENQGGPEGAADDQDCIVDPRIAEVGDLRTPMVRIKDPGQADRCGQTRNTGDQCIYVSVPGTKYCKLHCGGGHAAALARRTAKLYDLMKYRAKLDRLEGTGLAAASRLTEELGILRMALESLVQKGDEVEFVSNAPKITACVREIRETLKIDRQMAVEMGELLDKALISRVCEGLVEIIHRRVPADQLQAVTDEVAVLLATTVAKMREEK